MPLPTTPVVNDLRPDRARMVLHSPPGYGKTTLAAGWFPDTNLLIDLEGGTRFLPGSHFREQPKTYSEFSGLVTELAAGGHQFTTVTIDTGDHLVRMADAEAGQRGGKVAAGLVEFGKGMADRDGTILRDLTRLLATDLGVILCAHSTRASVTDEQGAESERLFPRIDKDDERLRLPIIGLFDFMFYVSKGTDDARALITGGARGIETKRRVALPDQLPADPNALYQALVAGCQQIQGQAQAVAA